MDDLYLKVIEVLNEPNVEEAKNKLFGVNGLNINSREYYERIVSSFVRKKELILSKISGEIYYDLNTDVQDVWDIIFIGQFVLNYWQMEALKIKEHLSSLEKKLKNNNFNLEKVNEINEEIIKLRKLYQLFNNEYKQKIESIAAQKVRLNNISEESNIDNQLIELKKAIAIIGQIRGSFEHRAESTKLGRIFEIDNSKNKFKVNIPSEYIDGFNKGRIIARAEDSNIVEITNEIVYPLLKQLGFNSKNIESFFYNVDPYQLSFLLEVCDNQVENLYKLPMQLFNRTNNMNKIIRTILEINHSKILLEKDYELLNSISFEFNDKYTKNLQLLLYYNSKLNLSPKEISLLSEIFTKFEYDITKDKNQFDDINKILNNYIKLKNCFSEEYFEIFNKISYKIYNMPFEEAKSLIYNIIRMKELIKSFDHELNRKIALDFNFNCFIENENLLPYLPRILNILSNIELFAPDKNPAIYLSQLFLELNGRQILKQSVGKSYNYRKMDDKERTEIESIINRYENNCEITLKYRLDGIVEYKQERKKVDYHKLLIETVKDLINKKITFKEYLKDKDSNSMEWSYIQKLIPYETELYYLIDKIQNYDISIEIIEKLGQFVHINIFEDDGMFYNRDFQELFHKKILKNFIRNVNIILEHGNGEDLLKYPVELLISDEYVFVNQFTMYNSIIAKSIFGIDNPKVIATIVYANSVLSKINTNTNSDEHFNSDNIDFTKLINDAGNDTKNYMAINGNIIDNNEYITQFGNNNHIISKLRNALAHFRFKPVKDSQGKIIDNKIYLYDEYNDGRNNFNLVVNLNDFVEMIRNIDISYQQQLISKQHHSL